jgi:hypothetical protein
VREFHGRLGRLHVISSLNRVQPARGAQSTLTKRKRPKTAIDHPI